jgi:glutaredoxin
VTKRRREWFEARIGALAPAPEQKAAALADEGVTLYRTAWCGVCRAAASFFRERNVSFVEKDIEKDPAARTEMIEKARAAGKTPTGVPVIDFHGNVLLGFQEEALDRLVRARAAQR